MMWKYPHFRKLIFVQYVTVCSSVWLYYNDTIHSQESSHPQSIITIVIMVSLIRIESTIVLIDANIVSSCFFPHILVIIRTFYDKDYTHTHTHALLYPIVVLSIVLDTIGR